jgi:Uma2 family endonuclease
MALSPLRFPSDMRLTPVQFALLCAENREAVLELALDGQVLAMTPTGSETGGRNIELAFQLQRFARSGTTWKVFGRSSGFRLDDASVLSPEHRRGFAPLCPNLVVEPANPSDDDSLLSRPCAARLIFSRPMVPCSAGSSSPANGPWISGPPAATPSESKG